MRFVGAVVTIWLWVLSLPLQAQTNVTNGPCSPIITGPKGEVTIRCDSTGLTKAEADRQAKEFAEILNRIRQQNLAFRDVISRLDTIQGDMREVQRNLSGRHLSASEKEALLSSINSPVRGNILAFVPLSAGAEVSSYAMEFVAIQRAAHFQEQGGSPLGISGDYQVGLHLELNAGDVKNNKVPESCASYGKALVAELGTTQKVAVDPSDRPAPGWCWLTVGYRD